MIWGQISPAHGDRGAKPPEGGQRPLNFGCCVLWLCFVLWLAIWVEYFVRQSKRFMAEQNLILWKYTAMKAI